MARFESELLASLIHKLSTERSLKISSLIVSIFGDMVAPRGGVIWLGSLITSLEALNVSHRLVRTAVYRLVQDDILRNEQRGRRSFYSLTNTARGEFEDATRRIYADHPRGWDQQWCLVLINLVPSEHKVALRKNLAWQGFGQFGPDVFIHPSPDRARLRQHLEVQKQTPNVVVMTTDATTAYGTDSVAAMISQAWDLPRLEKAYANFVDDFHPLLNSSQEGNTFKTMDAFYIRILLVHEYRRILLHDPGLPPELLPADWQGHRAYEITRQLYRAVVTEAERYVDTIFENEHGQLPSPNEDFRDRFSGLGDLILAS